MTSLLFAHADAQLAVITADGAAAHGISYQRLRHDIASANARLQPRSLLFIVGHNDYAVVRWYLAALEYGHVVMLLPADIASEQLQHLLALYQPRYLLVTPTRQLTLPSNWQACALDAAEPATEPGTGAAPYQSWQNSLPQPALHPDLALLTSTSGSTGAPKLVRMSKANLVSNASAIARYLQLGPHERAIAHLPLSYSFGLSILNSHLYAGGSVVLTNASLMAREFWHAVEQQQVTSFSGVPYHYEMLLKLRFARMKFHQIRTMTQAGGALAVPLLQQLLPACQEKQIRLVVMYGQTEASPRISYVPSERLADKLGSIGVAIPDGELWLRDASGQRIDQAEVEGELMYQGANVCLGYAQCAADLARGDDLQHVLATGDLARRDADGFYFITGRLKRFLKIFGNRISLDQLEQLLANDGITAVCTGVDDALTVHWQTAAANSDEVNSDEVNSSDAHASDAAASALQHQVAALCGVHFSAIRVRRIAQIPRFANGKVDYQCLT